MLHKRSLPDEFFQDLDKVFKTKLQLLTWLLRNPPQTMDDSSLLEQQFGPSVGKWFWKRIREVKNRTAFGTAMMQLAAKAQAEPAEANSVADAIAHDAEFHTRWNTDGNELKFPRLHPDWLETVRNVAEPFYDWLADTGFDCDSFSLNGNKINRSLLMQKFRRKYPIVCGYCDGPLGDVGTKLEANDCDHFFPKSKWPHLAIHPANLFSACKDCNETWKLDKVPMGSGDASGLNDTYHPMLRAGVTNIVVNAVVSTATDRLVKIQITDPSFPRRAETLSETLDLESRWTNSVNEKLDQGVSVLIAKSARDKGLGKQPTADSVHELIQNDIDWKNRQIGKEERSIREIAVLECMKTNLLNEIVAELSQ